MNKNDGGPAFPRVEIKTLGNGDLKAVDHPGLSLRDYFAAEAMKSFSISEHELRLLESGSEANHEFVANFCYAIADAMLKERER